MCVVIGGFVSPQSINLLHDSGSGCSDTSRPGLVFCVLLVGGVSQGTVAETTSKASSIFGGGKARDERLFKARHYYNIVPLFSLWYCIFFYVV